MEQQVKEIYRTVEDSRVETVHVVRPNHLNSAGRLFGGMLMQWIDEVAGLVAKRHARSNVITAAVDNLKFLKGAYVGDVITIIGKATYVGRTSMEVRVDTYVEDQECRQHIINRAYFVMVGLDENDKPMEIPGLILNGIAEEEEWLRAEKRKLMRTLRTEEGF